MNKIANFFKNAVIKFLKKKLSAQQPKHYYFYRWLVDLIEDKQHLNDVCVGISKWVLKSPSNAKFFIYIKDVFVLDNIVYIYTDQPGMLIGKAGCVYDEIKQEINHLNTNYTIFFIEMNNVSYTKILSYIKKYNAYQY